MKTYCKELESDNRETAWPLGLYRRGMSFRFRRMAGGQKVFEVWGALPVADAIRKASRYNLDLEEGRQPAEVQPKKKVSAISFLKDTWLAKKATEVRAKSIIRYRAVIDHFTAYLESRGMAGAGMEAVTYEIASDYVTHRANQPLMPNGQKKFTRAMKNGASKKTLHFEREVLFSAFKEAVKRDLVKKNPFEEVRPKKPTRHEVASVHHPLTVEDETALLKACGELDETRADADNPRFHDIVLFLVRTGLRQDELCQLEWNDVDWKDGLIRIRQKQVEETRSVAIPESAVAGLKKRIEGKTPNESLFRDEKDISAFGVRLWIRAKGEVLAIKAGDVDLKVRRIVTKRTYSWKPKGTNGVVPMCKAVRDLLAKLDERKTSNFVFAHRDGGSCRVDLLAMLKTAKEKAGIKGNLRIHDLRHTLAFRLRRDKGVPLETIMGILRHADIRETLIYAPYSLDEGRSAMGKLDEAHF
jgi:integrase